MVPPWTEARDSVPSPSVSDEHRLSSPALEWETGKFEPCTGAAAANGHSLARQVTALFLPRDRQGSRGTRRLEDARA